ncbi:MAG TPA: IS110 family transposase [Acidimicrobiia bacterium]|nr:IS110 family transposase [Acidimicrobiia bacterium]
MSTVVVMGCDPHLDTVAVAVVDALGREVLAREVANQESGWDELAGVCARLGVARVGIEGASGYGRCLAQRLSTEGVVVTEVPTRVTARVRRHDGAAKTDPGDARAVARATARGEGTVWVDSATLEQIRVLSHRRDSLVETQTREVNALRALMAEVDPARAARTPRLRSVAAFERLARVEYDGDPHRETVGLLIRQTAADCARRFDQIKQITHLLGKVMPPVGKALMRLEGIGVVTACQILAEVAGSGGFSTPAKMAAWAGISPLDASSGRQQRHRLNRGGNRRANRAVHTMITTQLRHRGEAADYIGRRIQEGKTQREAIRAAKRHAIRRIWKTLRNHGLT